MDQVSGVVRPKTLLPKSGDTMEEGSGKPTKRQKQDPEAATEQAAIATETMEIESNEQHPQGITSAEASSQCITASEAPRSAVPAVSSNADLAELADGSGDEHLKKTESNSNGRPHSVSKGAAKEDCPAEIVSNFVAIEPIPYRTPRLIALTQSEMKELEAVLEISVDSPEDSWPEDWNGNLLLADKDILNPQVKLRDAGTYRQSLILWAKKSAINLRLLHGLMRHVYHLKKTPEAAKKLLASTDHTSVDAMERTIRRVSYDPTVLRQDGWTTRKSLDGVGASGGPVHIGTKIRWQQADAVVIAFVHDSDIGDLWKALWIDGDDFETFDLEAEELTEAQRKWERRQKTPGSNDNSSRRSSRFAVSSDFTVDGIEFGIVLGARFSKGARQGVYWPARLAHASEDNGVLTQGKRTSSKQKVELVFLAPYWTSSDLTVRGRKVESLSESGGFDFAPLLQVESVDANAEMIKEYPYRHQKEIDLDELRMVFRFTGLPKGAFSRFVDSHRLAMSLKVYAQTQLRSKVSDTDRASAGLFESHPMSVQTPIFPPVLLHLPFSYILSQLPKPTDEKFGRAGNGKGSKEPIIQLKLIVDSMKPPECWGGGRKKQKLLSQDAGGARAKKVLQSAESAARSNSLGTNGHHTMSIGAFTEDLDELNATLLVHASVPQVQSAVNGITGLLADMAIAVGLDAEYLNQRRRNILLSWAIIKKLGEGAFASLPVEDSPVVVNQWCQAAERVFKKLFTILSTQGLGEGTSVAISDPRCNEHRTSDGSMERRVRLPAALKGIRLAGIGGGVAGRMVSSVPDHYLDFVEEKVLLKAHSASYLRRMQTRCAAAPSNDQVVILTDDSDGKGGEDTYGSRGTWKAAVAGVAAAIAGVDMIFRGECLNVFCATRPPGHHAGRALHPMKAVSNGFCVLNSVACAAMYAVSPVTDGGLGLSRICVLDFDVHHGNGTQDILCSTFDPRFLYVSLHAGGAHVNGFDSEGADAGFNSPGGKSPTSGVYPGRCGDTSPHKGVLNIPLGAKVMSHEVGVALLTRVKPAVLSFAPDLIILSAGFDAHKSDPMGLGGLTAEDFATITDAACSLANASCSGRVLSVLEGGYGVPCCRPQRATFLPPDSGVNGNATDTPIKTPDNASNSVLNLAGSALTTTTDDGGTQDAETKERPQPNLLDLGDNLPSSMDDQVPYPLQRRLEKCHSEGFVDCVQEHVQALLRWNSVYGPRRESHASE